MKNPVQSKPKPQPMPLQNIKGFQEVSVMQELMDTEDIGKLIASLSSMANDEPQSAVLVEKEKPRLSLGDNLYGFNTVGAPKQEKSTVLGEMSEGSEFKEAGILDEMFVSEDRQSLANAFQAMMNKKGSKINETYDQGIYLEI